MNVIKDNFNLKKKKKIGVICLLSVFYYWAMDLKMSKRFFLGASEKLYCPFEKHGVIYLLFLFHSWVIAIGN